MPSGRFYGMVIGGSHPAALAADWLTSAWDQNSALRTVTPAHTAVEDVTSAWLLELLGLPASGAVGFVTGATTANFTALAAARGEVLRRAGWDVRRDGLTGAPRVRVLVGAERHESVDLALSYLGLRAPEVVAADDQGRVSVAALEEALADQGSTSPPTIVVLQAGNVHSGAFDPFGPAVEAAHRHGAWVHVDGAFGLFAAASPSYRHLVAGYEGADSWATDAHKTLNVPYDCGLAIVADPVPLRAAMGMHGDYLIQSAAGDPWTRCPSSRGAVARFPSGPCCGRSAARAWRTSWTGSAATRRRSPTRCGRSTARSCTTSSSPRCARRSVTTRARRTSCGACSTTGRRGCPARAGTTAPCCASP